MEELRHGADSEMVNDIGSTIEAGAHSVIVIPIKRFESSCANEIVLLRYTLVIKKHIPIPNPPQPTLASPSQKHQD
jgi:hypothetical protein